MEAYAKAIDSRLALLLPPAERPPARLHEAMRYSCLAPGKRLRPALCLASAVAVSAKPSDGYSVLDAACAVEMVHCFSLIHDDLPAIDNDDLRRGRPTCHVQFGEALAILAGDALFALAFEVMSGASDDPAKALRALRALTIAAGSDGLVGGEVVDVLSEGQDVSAETLEFIHSRKTGSLIACACEIGALLGGGTDAQVEALRSYGALLGHAFQIVDDILNEVGSPEELGKAAGSDQDRKKATYPALFGLDRSREMAQELAFQAERMLKDLPGDSSVLASLTSFVLQRTK